MDPELFDPTRLRKLWDRPADDENGGGKAAPRDADGQPIEPPDPMEVALDNLEAAVRRDLGAAKEPLEPFLAKARELIMAQLETKRAEKEKAELAAWVAKAEAAAAAAGIDLTETPPAETPPAEAPPTDAAPAAEAGPRKQLKKQKGPPTKQGPGADKLGGEELDSFAETFGQQRTLSEFRLMEDNVTHGDEREAARAKQEEDAERDDPTGGRRDDDFTDYGLGTTLGISALTEGVVLGRKAKQIQRDIAFMREDEERRKKRLAALKPLNKAELEVNKATLGQVLDQIEDLYRALKITIKA